MPSSAIDLHNPDAFSYDDSGRSAAFFCKRTCVKIDAGMISELKRVASGLGDKNVRVCLHDSPDAAFHEMINLEHQGGYYRPHRHLTKGESYHIIEGSLAAFVFDEQGNIADANVLEPKDNFLYRVGMNTYHAVMPLTSVVIYHESKPGPFLRERDSLFAPWAPDGQDPEEARRYTEKLLAYVSA